MSKDPEPEISQDVSMTDASTSPTTKRKRSETSQPPVTQCTIRNPPWSYLHLSLITSAPNYQLDALTAHLHLRAALSQFLGLHGTAIPVDILKLKGSDVHVRVPREDASAVVIAVGGWMGKGGEGWRVKSQGSWGVGLSSSAEVDLFNASKERAKTTMRALDRNRTCDLLVIEVYAVLRHLYPRCFHVRGAHLHSPDVIPLHRRGFAWGTAKSMEYVAQVCGMIRTLGRSVDQKRWSREEL
ncbi:hypothetical protein E4T43_05807 [Aureobasidium subglaciale]|nr:hypothetical protein E4T43_05807 [Aureobasidium subglaciale]